MQPVEIKPISKDKKECYLIREDNTVYKSSLECYHSFLF